jgi:hypothetical protein
MVSVPPRDVRGGIETTRVQVQPPLGPHFLALTIVNNGSLRLSIVTATIAVYDRL